MAEGEHSVMRKQLEQAMAALEAQRASLGDAVVEVALAPLREKLAALTKAGASTSELQGERKLVTVMFADLSGFTALAERLDPEAVRETMNACFEHLVPVIEKYEGAVDKFIGDEIMALFGAPVAHENDPERALRAALEMVEALGKLNADRGTDLGLHFGINTGLVIAGDIGTRERQAYSVMGDAVNLASRLEDASERDEILVGPDTYRLTAPLFEFQALTPMRMKGKAEPVLVYRLLAAKAIPGPLRGIAGIESPLVGRQAELRALAEAVERLQAGVGSIVTLVAEAGLGKSRLVAEVRRGVVTTPVHWVEGRCLSYGASIAYLLWLDVLRGLLGVTPEAAPAAVGDVLRERVQAVCPGRTEEVTPYLARLMSLPLTADDETALRGLEGEGLKLAVFHAVETLLEGAAGQRPLVVVCEDMHWADPTSMELLEQLLALTDRAPLLFICVFRPETEHGCWRVKETAARLYRHRHADVWLDPLSAAESETLVGNLLRVEDLPPQLRARILGAAEGNPFYVEEIVRSLMESGAFVYDAASGRWQAAGDVAEIAIPDTLHGVLMARLDRLHEETKRVLQLASVIGRIFLYRVLKAIAEEEGALDAHLLTLQRGQLIRERARLPELEYIFKHHLTQEAAYDSLLKKERRLYHRQVAEALERLFPDRLEEQVGWLAHHWERAEEPEKAAGYLLRAGDQGRLAYANQEAIDTYRRALVLLARPPLAQARAEWRLAALKGLGQVYVGMGEVAGAEEPFRQALALGQEMRLAPRELARLYYWLGEAAFWQSRYDDMLRLGEEGLRLLGDDVESAEAILMNHLIAVPYAMKKGDEQRYREYGYRTAQFILRLPYAEELRPAYSCIAEAYWAGKNVEEALRWRQAFEDLAMRHGDLRGLAQAYHLAGWFSSDRGDLQGALAPCRQALALFTRIADAKHASWVLLLLGRIFLARGDLSQAEEHVDKWLAMARAVGNKEDVAEAYCDVGRVSLCQGAWEKAGDAFQKAALIAREIGLGWLEGYANYLWGQVYQAQGEQMEALKRFEEVFALAESAWLKLGLLLLDIYSPTLAGLEEACQDPAVFRAFCQKHLAVAGSPFIQWCLEPTQPHDLPRRLLHDEFLGPPAPEWTWQDPFADCSFAPQGELEIRAANGRDLWMVNLSAPRLLWPASGDFAVQTICLPVSNEKPAIGGLLLWKDQANYLRLARGKNGRNEIAFTGCLANGDVIGRGCLSFGPAGRVWLRLERIGGQVSALCSADGEHWFGVGQAAFPAEDPLQVGVCAIGNIDRTVYHGAYPEGTAIRFETFQMWGT
jgi:class 3 adenylate cyclase/tetratricopeptide (TPR) repeat protein/regulation of enolase protein 1 (concanavalin A-like superfamily)